jgi:hypothetical protein
MTPAASLPRAAVSRVSRHWTLEEDTKLTVAANNYGKYCWAPVGAMVPGGTRRQWRERWVYVLDPANGNKGTPRIWKLEADAKLTEAVHNIGKNWVVVAVLVPSRTNKQCRQQRVHALDPAIWNKGKWIPVEDAKLTEAVQKLGKDWVAATALVPSRTNKHRRQRWLNSLDPVKRKTQS